MSGVLLAAGRSLRFGGSVPKQLFELEGEPLVRRAARTVLAADLAELVVVVGFRADEVRKAIADLDLRVVENLAWAEGQSTSVRAGLAAVAAGSRAALFLPVDQPRLTPGLIDSLIECYRRTGGPVVAPVHRGRRGAPVLFDRSLFGELRQIEGDEGGRQVLRRRPEPIVEVEVEDVEELQDLDRRPG
ncbi:MAG: nucleotidyltransferase family protein [Acidobacteriota bacterium]